MSGCGLPSRQTKPAPEESGRDCRARGSCFVTSRLEKVAFNVLLCEGELANTKVAFQIESIVYPPPLARPGTSCFLTCCRQLEVSDRGVQRATRVV